MQLAAPCNSQRNHAQHDDGCTAPATRMGNAEQRGGGMGGKRIDTRACYLLSHCAQLVANVGLYRYLEKFFVDGELFEMQFLHLVVKMYFENYTEPMAILIASTILLQPAERPQSLSPGARLRAKGPSQVWARVLPSTARRVDAS